MQFFAIFLQLCTALVVTHSDLTGTELTTWFVADDILANFGWPTHICGAYDDSTGYIWLLESATHGSSLADVYGFNATSKSIEQHFRVSITQEMHCQSTSAFFFNETMYFYDTDDGIYTLDILYNDTSNDYYGIITDNAINLTAIEYLRHPCFMLSNNKREMYLVGDSNGISKHFYIYNIFEKRWYQGPNTNYFHRLAPCSISDNNELYIIGGGTTNYTEKIDLNELDSNNINSNIDNSNWTVINNKDIYGDSMNIPAKYGRVSVKMENIFFIIGGYDASIIYYINTNNDTFGELTNNNISIILRYVKAISMCEPYGDNRIYLFGGRQTDGTISQIIRYSNIIKSNETLELLTSTTTLTSTIVSTLTDDIKSSIENNSNYETSLMNSNINTDDDLPVTSKPYVSTNMDLTTIQTIASTDNDDMNESNEETENNNESNINSDNNSDNNGETNDSDNNETYNYGGVIMTNSLLINILIICLAFILLMCIVILLFIHFERKRKDQLKKEIMQIEIQKSVINKKNNLNGKQLAIRNHVELQQTKKTGLIINNHKNNILDDNNNDNNNNNSIEMASDNKNSKGIKLEMEGLSASPNMDIDIDTSESGIDMYNDDNDVDVNGIQSMQTTVANGETKLANKQQIEVDIVYKE